MNRLPVWVWALLVLLLLILGAAIAPRSPVRPPPRTKTGLPGPSFQDRRR